MIADLAAAIFIVTIIYVLVRPRSAAVTFVDAFAGAFASIVRTVTDL